MRKPKVQRGPGADPVADRNSAGIAAYFRRYAPLSARSGGEGGRWEIFLSQSPSILDEWLRRIRLSVAPGKEYSRVYIVALVAAPRAREQLHGWTSSQRGVLQNLKQMRVKGSACATPFLSAPHFCQCPVFLVGAGLFYGGCARRRCDFYVASFGVPNLTRRERSR